MSDVPSLRQHIQQLLCAEADTRACVSSHGIPGEKYSQTKVGRLGPKLSTARAV